MPSPSTPLERSSVRRRSGTGAARGRAQHRMQGRDVNRFLFKRTHEKASICSGATVILPRIRKPGLNTGCQRRTRTLRRQGFLFSDREFVAKGFEPVRVYEVNWR